MKISFLPSCAKITAVPEIARLLPPSLVLGRGDREWFQVCLAETADAASVSVSVESVFDTRVFSAVFVRDCEDAWLCDALLPGETAETSSSHPTVFAVELSTAKEQKAGVFENVLVLTVDGEKREYPFLTEIFDVELPADPVCESSVGVSAFDVAQVLGEEVDSALVTETHRAARELFLSYGLSPTDLGCKLEESEECYRALSDPRRTSFVMPANTSDEERAEYRAFFEKHPEWAKKVLYYPVDEPMLVQHLETLKERADKMRETFPSVTVVTPLHRDVDVSEDVDSFRFLEGITDLWCPKAALFSSYIYNEHQRATYPPIGERMRARKAVGDRLWWYVCCEPAAPYANVHMNLDLLEARVLFWQQAKEDVDGFLYWSGTYWKNTENALEHAPYYLMGGDTPVYGDGVLCYVTPQGEPVPSLRLLAIRDGMRDFALLSALRQKNPAAYEDLVVRVAPAVDNVLRDHTAFEAARKELYQLLCE